jgi:hypothetical protein
MTVLHLLETIALFSLATVGITAVLAGFLALLTGLERAARARPALIHLPVQRPPGG